MVVVEVVHCFVSAGESRNKVSGRAEFRLGIMEFFLHSCSKRKNKEAYSQPQLSQPLTGRCRVRSCGLWYLVAILQRCSCCGNRCMIDRLLLQGTAEDPWWRRVVGMIRMSDLSAAREPPFGGPGLLNGPSVEASEQDAGSASLAIEGEEACPAQSEPPAEERTRRTSSLADAAEEEEPPRRGDLATSLVKGGVVRKRDSSTRPSWMWFAITLGTGLVMGCVLVFVVVFHARPRMSPVGVDNSEVSTQPPSCVCPPTEVAAPTGIMAGGAGDGSGGGPSDGGVTAGNGEDGVVLSGPGASQISSGGGGSPSRILAPPSTWTVPPSSTSPRPRFLPPAPKTSTPFSVPRPHPGPLVVINTPSASNSPAPSDNSSALSVDSSAAVGGPTSGGSTAPRTFDSEGRPDSAPLSSCLPLTSRPRSVSADRGGTSVGSTDRHQRTGLSHTDADHDDHSSSDDQLGEVQTTKSGGHRDVPTQVTPKDGTQFHDKRVGPSPSSSPGTSFPEPLSQESFCSKGGGPHGSMANCFSSLLPAEFGADAGQSTPQFDSGARSSTQPDTVGESANPGLFQKPRPGSFGSSTLSPPQFDDADSDASGESTSLGCNELPGVAPEELRLLAAKMFGGIRPGSLEDSSTGSIQCPESIPPHFCSAVVLEITHLVRMKTEHPLSLAVLSRMYGTPGPQKSLDLFGANLAFVHALYETVIETDDDSQINLIFDIIRNSDASGNSELQSKALEIAKTRIGPQLKEIVENIDMEKDAEERGSRRLTEGADDYERRQSMLSGFSNESSAEPEMEDPAWSATGGSEQPRQERLLREWQRRPTHRRPEMAVADHAAK